MADDLHDGGFGGSPPHGLPQGAIDFHIHPFRLGHFQSRDARALVARANPSLNVGALAEEDEVIPRARLESELDAAGIAYGVLLPQHTPGVGIELPTDYVLAYRAGSSRLIPFASVNPLGDANPLDELRRWVDAGAKGLKLYPSYQFFYPNDPRLYPIYEFARSLSWPVMFHTGSSIFSGSRLKYALPIHLDDVAVDFPDLRIVLAHAGRVAWAAEAVALARVHPNVYLEISGLPPRTVLRHIPDLPRITDKVVFGSDWPSTPSIAETVGGLLELGLTPGQLARVFRDNAAALLGWAGLGGRSSDERRAAQA